MPENSEHDVRLISGLCAERMIDFIEFMRNPVSAEMNLKLMRV